MQKTKDYPWTRFSVEVLRAAAEELSRGLKRAAEPGELFVNTDDGRWSYDDVEDFYAAYRASNGWAGIAFRGEGCTLSVEVLHYLPLPTHISVKAPERARINAVFNIFDAHAETSRLPEPPAKPEPPVVVFIGHGRSELWRDLKDHLQDKHGFQIQAYEVGARAGHAVRDILEEMLDASSFAVLVMTGEDISADGTPRARQNVVHEVGLFQGRLGFNRAVVLLEEGTEVFTNIEGIAQLRFGRGNIRETFGDVVATIRREFPGES